MLLVLSGKASEALFLVSEASLQTTVAGVRLRFGSQLVEADVLALEMAVAEVMEFALRAVVCRRGCQRERGKRVRQDGRAWRAAVICASRSGPCAVASTCAR